MPGESLFQLRKFKLSDMTSQMKMKIEPLPTDVTLKWFLSRETGEISLVLVLTITNGARIEMRHLSATTRHLLPLHFPGVNCSDVSVQILVTFERLVTLRTFQYGGGVTVVFTQKSLDLNMELHWSHG